MRVGNSFHLSAQLANSIPRNLSSETESLSAGHYISYRLCNPNVHYRVHKIQSLNPVLHQMNPPRKNPYYYFYINLNITQTTTRPSKFLFPSGAPATVLYAFLFAHMRATYPTHLIVLNTAILRTQNSREQYAQECGDRRQRRSDTASRHAVFVRVRINTHANKQAPLILQSAVLTADNKQHFFTPQCFWRINNGRARATPVKSPNLKLYSEISPRPLTPLSRFFL